MKHPAPPAPVIPSKEKPKLADLPPPGTRFYQLARDKDWWSVWECSFFDGGEMGCKKVLERELYAIAREKWLLLNARMHQEQVK